MPTWCWTPSWAAPPSPGGTGPSPARFFYTTLEHQATVDYILSRFLPKGLAKLDPPVRAVLRSGLAQARWMEVPASAAVNESVKLTRALGKSSAAGLVNAVLRKACAFDLGTAAFESETQRLMVLGSAGHDVAEFLHKTYPEEALSILTAPADEGKTALRVNPLHTTPEALAAALSAAGVEAKPGLVPGSLLADFAGSPAHTEWFQRGDFHVEGQASQLAALLVEAKPGEDGAGSLRRPRRQDAHAGPANAGQRAPFELRPHPAAGGPDPHRRPEDGPCLCPAPGQRRRRPQSCFPPGRPGAGRCALQRSGHPGQKAGYPV